MNKTPTGRVFALGNDFRVNMGFAGSEDESRNLGIPRPLLSSSVVIVKTVLGKDHAVLLDRGGIVYCFGSNQFGQLGIYSNANNSEKKRPLESFTNPVT